MKKILITGASGWIGSFVARELVGSKYRVVALIRPNSSIHRIKNILSKIKLLKCDLNNTSRLSEKIRKENPKICIHLAWHSLPGHNVNSSENFKSLSESLNLLEALKTAGVRRLLIAGTCSEYAASKKPLTEQDEIKPANTYAQCKHALHEIAKKFFKNEECKLLWMRIFHVYGPEESNQRLIPSLINSLINQKKIYIKNPETVLDYINVKDLARHIVKLANSKIAGEINIGSGKAYKINKIAKTVRKVLDAKNLIIYPKKSQQKRKRIIANISKMIKVLKINPSQCKNLYQGVSEIIAYKSKRLKHKNK